MNNIERDLVEIASGEVEKRRKSPMGPMLYIVVGLAIALSENFIGAVKSNADMASAVMIVGWSVVIFGIIKLLVAIAGKVPVYIYKTTGEKLVKHEVSYDTEFKQRVCDCVRDGNFAALAKIRKSNISSVKVVFFSLGKKEILWSQVFEFIPHTHQPMTDIISYPKGQCAYVEV